MKKKFCLLLMPILLLGLFACLPAEEPILPAPTLSVPSPVLYDADAVVIGDVILFQDIRASLVPAREEELSFPMNGILIDSVNVRVGDFVHEGDIIIELERSSYARDLEEVNRDLERAELSLRQLEEAHALNLDRARLSGVSVDTVSYTRQYDTYRHQIEVLNIKKENLEYELERRVLRGSMDGYVTSIVTFNEGDVTVADRRLATIADATETIFMVSGESADLLHVGDEVELAVQSDVLHGIVIDPLEYNITADRSDYEAYILVEDGHRYGLTATSFGMIRVIIDTSREVLCVPTRSVHLYNGRAFVFVLEDELPVLRDIEIGLMGNTFTEIQSGLEPGELVIRW